VSQANLVGLTRSRGGGSLRRVPGFDLAPFPCFPLSCHLHYCSKTVSKSAALMATCLSIVEVNIHPGNPTDLVNLVFKGGVAGTNSILQSGSDSC